MEQKEQKPMGPEALFSQWMASASSFWNNMAQTMMGQAEPSGLKTAPLSEESTDDRQAVWESTMKNMEIMSRFILDPSGPQSVLKGFTTFPDMLMKMGQGTWEGWAQVQEKWVRYTEAYPSGDQPYSFKNLDREFLNRWTDVYEREFSRFYKIPQVGLVRFYLEDINDAVDKFNRCQAAITEFMHLLYLPMERSYGVLQEKVSSMADSGELPEDPKKIYNLWVKILEGHYMTLFKSSEYTETMGKTINALNNYLTARKKVYEALLQSLPVATEKDVDSLYEEIYDLKKRIRKLERDKATPSD